MEAQWTSWRRVRLRRHALAPRQLRAVPAPGRRARGPTLEAFAATTATLAWRGRDQWTATQPRRRCCGACSVGGTPRRSTTPPAAFADDIVRRHLRERGGRAGRLAPDPGPPPRDRVGVARRSTSARSPSRCGSTRCSPPSSRWRRRPADRSPGRRQRARPREGPPARRVARRAAPRSCGPTATARAIVSSGPAPIAPSASAGARTAARPDAGAPRAREPGQVVQECRATSTEGGTSGQGPHCDRDRRAARRLGGSHRCAGERPVERRETESHGGRGHRLRDPHRRRGRRRQPVRSRPVQGRGRRREGRRRLPEQQGRRRRARRPQGRRRLLRLQAQRRTSRATRPSRAARTTTRWWARRRCS